MEILNKKIIILKTPRAELITSKIKKSKIINHLPDGLQEVAINFGLLEAQQLTELKIKNVPSTILRDYEWTGNHKPFDHQKDTASFLTLYKKAFCFNEQGTGKTAAVIWATDYLMEVGHIKKVLIICPLSIMKSAWQTDLFSFAPHRKVDIAYGKKETRVEVINGDSEFTIINYDGVNIVKENIINNNFDLIVVDEASAYKNAQTQRWKTLKSIIKDETWLWMLTGTPAAQSPADAFGLAKLINPNNIPKFFGQFRDSVMQKASMFKWIPRPNSELTVHNALQPAIRFKKSECLDLPELTYVHRS
jgi:SNF2 family DNA or RNA helicase